MFLHFVLDEREVSCKGIALGYLLFLMLNPSEDSGGRRCMSSQRLRAFYLTRSWKGGKEGEGREKRKRGGRGRERERLKVHLLINGEKAVFV